QQNPDGGFGNLRGATSNAQSTAWAVQGIVAAGRGPDSLTKGSRSPTEYLASLQAPDGSIRYSRTSAQTPVWVTGQALTALERAPFPLPRVRRRPARAAGAPAERGAGKREADRKQRREPGRRYAAGSRQPVAAAPERLTLANAAEVSEPITGQARVHSGWTPLIALAAIAASLPAAWYLRRRLRRPPDS
ncbi:MAG: hypothetical protein H0T15_03740, partial [Thermoleophilaceae bacterium]|nr:hypothetical protein [Thermoleophilaceae bacterium]